ncbi:MAG: hypothetical protein ACT4QC_09665 [Planctomycetaceae bacterium]
MSERRWRFGELSGAFARWSSMNPNGRLAALGVAMIVLPSAVIYGARAASTLLGSLPAPLNIVAGVVAILGIWLYTGTFLGQPAGLLLISFAIWRAVRDQQRRLANHSIPIKDNLSYTR